MADGAWYVLQSKRHKERLAQHSLGNRGIRTYLPWIIQWPRPAVGSAVVPMFPGYLFAQLVLPDDFSLVSWTPGVKAFVAFGGGAVPIDSTVITFLQDREGADGLIRCGNSSTDGSEVRITNGPFRGLTAVIEQRLPARERVRVLIHFLQRETPVELPEGWVCLA